jgi:hypothetical protein
MSRARIVPMLAGELVMALVSVIAEFEKGFSGLTTTSLRPRSHHQNRATPE